MVADPQITIDLNRVFGEVAFDTPNPENQQLQEEVLQQLAQFFGATSEDPYLKTFYEENARGMLGLGADDSIPDPTVMPVINLSNAIQNLHRGVHDSLKPMKIVPMRNIAMADVMDVVLTSIIEKTNEQIEDEAQHLSADTLLR